jgi:tripartite-type tricarboxylate transporter receptor subunit TctC
MFRLIFKTAAALLFVTSQTQAQTDDYPNKPVSIVVAYAPGGQGDTFARLVGERLTTVLKQSVVVDNKPGVSGVLGTRIVAKAKNDGYTLLLGQTGEMVVNRLLMKDMGYDPMKELIPVVLIGNAPLVLLAPADAPYNTVAEFMQAAKSKSGEFSYGSVGAGTPGHLSAVALGLGANLNMVHVPYKGVGPLMSDLMTNRVQIFLVVPLQRCPKSKGASSKLWL